MPPVPRFRLCPFVSLSLVLAVSAQTMGQAAPPMPVAVTPAVERRIPPSLRLVGTIRPDKSAIVAAEVSGLIADFAAEEGQLLRHGEVICRMDPTVAKLRVDEARAVLAGFEAQLQELLNGERPEELRRLEAAVAEAQASLDKWAFERKRIAELFERGQSSDKEKHDVEMDYLAASGRLAQATAELEKARNGARAEDIARARQNVIAQQTVVRRLERDLEKTEIRAPFDGEIVAKRTEIGEWIDAGGPVCDMIARETVKVRADVPESAIPFARVGAAATIEIEALRRSLSAKISRVIPQAIPAARTFPVEIDVANTDHTLLPGMFVWVYVPAGPVGKRLMVSKDAIVAEGPRKTIYVVRASADGTKMAMPTPVTTGLELGGEIEVQAPGLAPDDLVVSRANERLFGPTPVIPTPMKTPPPASTQPTGSAEPQRAGDDKAG